MRAVLPKEPKPRSWRQHLHRSPCWPFAARAAPQLEISSATMSSSYSHKTSWAPRLAEAEFLCVYLWRQCNIFFNFFPRKMLGENAREKCMEEGKNVNDHSIVALPQTNVCEYFCESKRILFAVCCVTLEREYLKIQAHICRKSSANYEKTEKMDIKCSNICRGFFNSSKSKRNENLVKGE